MQGVMNLAAFKAIARFMQNFHFIYQLAQNCFYYLRLGGLKVKLLWETLDHYFLIRFVLRSLWREKLITFTLVGYLAYFLHYRESKFINPTTSKIWI